MDKVIPLGPRASRVNIESVATLGNDELTYLTIARMGELVRRDQGHPYIQECVEYAVGEKSNDQLTMMNQIHRWIKTHIRFVDDSKLVYGWLKRNIADAMDCEVLVSPARLVSMALPQGDCDDFSMLAKVMLEEVGVYSKFVTIKGNPDNPYEWSHVYLAAWNGNADKWIGFDASHGKYVGWEAKMQWEKRVWEI